MILMSKTINMDNLERFLTSDNCYTNTLSINLSLFLNVLPFLKEDDCRQIDQYIISEIDKLPYISTNGYFMIRYDKYPMFVKICITDPTSTTFEERIISFSDLGDTSLCEILRSYLDSTSHLVLQVTSYCPQLSLDLSDLYFTPENSSSEMQSGITSDTNRFSQYKETFE